ncbi:GNAT family N-acetyltransferase [Desulfosporosinus fructosivorans]
MDIIKPFDKTVKELVINDFILEKGTINDIDELENLYDKLNEYFELGTNYPGWAKGLYPIRETAVNGIQNNSLFVLKVNNEIAGSIILNHEPETAYDQVTWGIEADYKDVIVIHTLVVHPKYMKNGIGEELMNFAKRYSIEQRIKTIRLDVSIHNTPAISLYEKCGYKYVETVDLGLNVPGLVWFKLYELALLDTNVRVDNDCG